MEKDAISARTQTVSPEKIDSASAMRSDNSEIKRDNRSVSGDNAVASLPKKIRFGMKLYPETLDMIDVVYQKDNCCSRSEFIEKAVRFYIGYLHNQDHTAIEYLAPQLAHIIEGYTKGSEQRLARAIFKLAVEVGAQTHMLAAINDIEETTLFKLRDMVTDEVRRINGIINFESAVRYQRSEE